MIMSQLHYLRNFNDLYFNDFDMSMTLIFQWLWYFNDFDISMTSIFQWLRYFNDFDISMTLIFQRLRYFSDFDISMTSMFQWLRYLNDFHISMKSIFQWLLDFIDSNSLTLYLCSYSFSLLFINLVAPWSYRLQTHRGSSSNLNRFLYDYFDNSEFWYKMHDCFDRQVGYSEVQS